MLCNCIKKLNIITTKTIAILASLIIIFSSFSFQSFAAEQDNNSITTSNNNINKTVKAGIFAFDGYHMRDDGGKYSGYGIDILNMMSEYSHLNFEYVEYSSSWNDMLDMLEKGEIDVVTSASKTSDRLEKFDYSLPIGRKSTILSVSVEEDRFSTGNYTSYSGMKVGEIKGNTANVIFDEFAKENKFAFIPVLFESESALAEALKSGDVDAALTSDLRKRENEKTLEVIHEKDFYAITKKGNKALLDEINYAIEQMDIEAGDWRNILYYKYYEPQYSQSTSFTSRQLEYIKQVQSGEKKIIAAVYNNMRPYSFVENGHPKGILVDYFASLMEEAGLPYDIIVVNDKQEYEKLVENNEIDVVIDCIDAKKLIDNYFQNGFVSTKIMDTNIVKVTRNNNSGENKRIAIHNPLANQKHYEFIPEINDGNVEAIFYDNSDEALQALSDGKLDAVYVYVHTAQEFINHPLINNLSYKILYNMESEFNIAISSRTDHELVGIINKCINKSNKVTITELTNNYISHPAKNISFMEFLIINPIFIALACVILVLVIAFIIYLVLRIRWKNQLYNTAQKANESKTVFLNSVSHDIRTPMNAIIGYSSLASEHIDNTDKVKEYLNKIEISSKHLLGLINDVLDMSRIESGRVEINNERTNINNVISSLQSIVQTELEKKNLHLFVDLGEMKNNEVICDKVHLEQILLNILSNAVKYTPSGGDIFIKVIQKQSIENTKSSYVFKITDTGIGMSEEFLKRLFSPFEREKTSTVSGIQGTGLGLSITKKLVTLMDGTITVKSEVGKGSEFEVSFVFENVIDDNKKEKENNLTKDNQEQEIARLDGIKILLAEDNAMSREIVVTLLMEAGAIVDAVEDGSYIVEKMKACTAGQYDLILTDIQMPIMNGYQAANAVRALKDEYKRNIPIIAISANVFEEDKQIAEASGINGYIPKPIDINKLVSMCISFVKRVEEKEKEQLA